MKSMNRDMVARLIFLPGLLFLSLTSGARAQSNSQSQSGVQSQSATTGYDPVTMDPAAVDSLFPPRFIEYSFQSHGKRLNAFWLIAGGEGSHPTVVLLHGFPGNEKNLDLAQALRRGGINVLFFHYRGAWGSGGDFSLSNALEDVQVAIDTVRASDSPSVDPSRIALVGHSMGGGLALLGTAADPDIECVVALDHWNFGLDGKALAGQSEAVASARTEFSTLFEEGAPLNGEFDEFADDLMTNADANDILNHVDVLKTRKLLLISTPIFEHHYEPLVERLNAVGAENMRSEVWQTDHAFSDKRIELSRAVYSWLHDTCGY